MTKILLPEGGGGTKEAPLLEAAQAYSHRADTTFRGVMVVVMAIIFLGLNAAVMWFVYLAFNADLAALAISPSVPRLITTQVILALIGATVVQVGTLIITIVSYLFPKDRNKSD